MSTQWYCFDSSAFIDSWRRYYPPDVLPSLWGRLSDLVQSDRIKAPDQVLLEIARGSDELRDWAKSHSQMFVPETRAVQRQVSQIINSYPNFLQERSPDGVWADPYVIAVARVENRILVTWEKPAARGARRIKIPDVCSALGVECINLLDLMRREGWTF
jgi:hypothetical protein